MPCFIPEPAPFFSRDWHSDPETEMILFCGRDIIVQEENGVCVLPRAADVAGVLPCEALKVGEAGGRRLFAAEPEELPEELPGGLTRIPFRTAAGKLDRNVCPAVFRGREQLFWRKQHRLCGSCGAALRESESDPAMICPACGMRYYPQLAPAVIAAVLHEGRILLAHNRNFQQGVYGLIAGFVEAGESAEDAVAREIREETGIEVGNIRYFSSQCWPFPNSLMLGYYADYVSGEARPDGVELESLGWFSPDDMPQIPPPGSIARRLIEDYLSGYGQ